MLVSSREVDGLDEIITVETDGVVTSRTINGVEQRVSQNIPPSLSRSAASRTAGCGPTPGHSTDRLRNNGTAGASSGGSASSFPNSASNSVLFRDSKKRADSSTVSGSHVHSSPIQLERKDTPASKEVPAQTGNPVKKSISVQKDVPSGEKGAERKDFPAVPKEVSTRMDVPGDKAVSPEKEVPIQQVKEVGRHPNVQDRQETEAPQSAGLPKCGPASDNNEVAEERHTIPVKGSLPPTSSPAEGLNALSSNPNRKTLIYSRVVQRLNRTSEVLGGQHFPKSGGFHWVMRSFGKLETPYT